MEIWQFIVLIAAVLLSGAAAVIAILLTRGRDNVGDLLITYKNDNERNIDRAKKDISEDMEQQMR